MEFVVREATIDDARAIAQVQVESWKTTYAGIVPDAHLASLNVEEREEQWKELFAAANSLMFVVESNVGIFGFVSGGKLREPIDGYDAELYAIYLLRDNQRKGAGRRLVESLAESLRAKGFRAMAVWVLKKNPAVDFYRRMGGVPILEKLVEIGGVQLDDMVIGWPDLGQINSGKRA